MVLLDAVFPDEVDLERYFPGTLEKVESGHYMEAAVPDRIVEELEQVIAKS